MAAQSKKAPSSDSNVTISSCGIATESLKILFSDLYSKENFKSFNGIVCISTKIAP